MRSWIVPALAVAMAFGTGLVTGMRIIDIRMRKGFVDQEAWQTLGRVFPKSRRENLAKAYPDPAALLANVDRIPWAIENTPAPFVGSHAEPGDHDGVYIDPLGMRASHPIERAKVAGTFRVILTGGSNAFGTASVSFADTVGGRLEVELAEVSKETGKRYEVIVLANPTWASTHERIAIENVASELSPDLVISFSGGNDVYFGFGGFDVLWFRTPYEKLHRDVLSLARGRPFADDAAMPANHPVAPALVVARFTKNAHLASLALRDVGARFVVALQPMIETTTKALTPSEKEIALREPAGLREYHAGIFADLRGSVGSAGVDVVDLSDAFAGQEGEIFIDAHHNGDTGNRILAASLVAALRPILR